MKKLCIIFLVLLLLVGCEDTEDIWDAYDTDLEVYHAMFTNNRGKFLMDWVDPDITLRWKCSYFFGGLNIKSIKEEGDGTYLVESGEQSFRVTIISHERVIQEIMFDEVD